MSANSEASSALAAAPTFDLLGMDRQIQRRIARQRTLRATAWLGLVAIGLSKRGVLGWLGAGAGLFALTRELLVWREQRPEWQRTRAATAGTSLTSRVGRLLLRSGRPDPVDHSSATSFPASDAPTHSN